jgi:tetratricopeptide (TPR) repeat protein
VEEANRDPQSMRAANLLEFAGGVFFLDGALLDCVAVSQRADGIAPLSDPARFTLAMALVKLRRPESARLQLEKLATVHPGNPLYLYWLARLDYDSHKYAEAIARLQRVTELDPKMTRAYNLLGLCYDYQGHLNDAIGAFSRAIELNHADAKPSPWPNLDMANSQIELNQLGEAERNLQEAITYDPHFPQARYNLGRVLEKEGKYEEAVRVLRDAVGLDQLYAEPHYLLGRIYQRLGQAELAKNEIQRYLYLKKMITPASSSSSK